MVNTLPLVDSLGTPALYPFMLFPHASSISRSIRIKDVESFDTTTFIVKVGIVASRAVLFVSSGGAKGNWVRSV